MVARRTVPRARTLLYMSEPARDLPVEQPKLLTVGGQRVAAIVPEPVIEALRAAEDAQDAAEADAAMDEAAESIAQEALEAEFGL